MNRLLERLGYIPRSKLIRILAQRLADLKRSADESEFAEEYGMSASYQDQASAVKWIARCLCMGYEVYTEARKLYEFE